MLDRKLALSLAALLVALYLVGSVTRTISATQDSKELLIQNSKGNYWETLPANIQPAIDDLGASGGTVWLPSKVFNITSTVIVKENVLLDMGGASFKLPQGYDITMVELKNGAGIRNGGIDVAGHITYCRSYSQFSTPHSAIFLNASSNIEKALIEDMVLESIGLGYNDPNYPNPDTDCYYNGIREGRGYGIHLYASNAAIPQKITGVTVKDSFFRAFKNAVLIQNTRNPAGSEPGARIDGNTFEFLWFDANELSVNISRNTAASSDKCSTSGNAFNNIQLQTGGGSWWGGEAISWHYIIADGYNNAFTDIMGWDAGQLRTPSGDRCDNVAGDPCVEVIFTSDSANNFISGRCGLSNDPYGVGKSLDYGTNNTKLDTALGNLTIGAVLEQG